MGTLSEDEWAARNTALEATKPRCPNGIWGRAVDALARFRLAGNAWVDAGRPRDCELYTSFCEAEREYNQCRDDADRHPWAKDQREEWTRVFAATEGR